MSLAATSEARKARLIALKWKRAGGEFDENGDGTPEPVLSKRNFDPETRTLRKRQQEDVDMDDTVERHVEGLAEQIITEDEERRAQDLDLFNIAPKRPIGTSSAKRLAAQKGESDDLAGAIQAEAGPEDEPLSDQEDD